MNILVLTNNYKPFVGGVSIAVESIVNTFKEQGHNVYVVAPDYGTFEDENNVVRCKTVFELDSGYVIPNVFNKQIKEVIKEKQIDILHVHQPILMGNIALHFSKKYNIPLFFTYHTKYEDVLDSVGFKDVPEGIKSLFVKYVLHNYLKYFVSNCDGVIVPTLEIKEQVIEKYKIDNINVIPTGLKETSFTYDGNTVDEIRNELNILDKKVFLTVSRLSQEKNLFFLLDTIKEYSYNNQDFVHLIVGNGELYEDLEQRIIELGLEDHVILCGNVSHEKLVNYYKLADLFLFSSISETQGLVLLEAMAMSTPVVAVAGSGINDIVEYGVNGYNINLDSKSYIECINLALHSESYRMLSGNALNTARKFKIENSTKQLAQFFNNHEVGVQHAI